VRCALRTAALLLAVTPELRRREQHQADAAEHHVR